MSRAASGYGEAPASSGYESLDGQSALVRPLEDSAAPGSELDVALEPATESSLSLGYVVHRVCTRTTLDRRARAPAASRPLHQRTATAARGTPRVGHERPNTSKSPVRAPGAPQVS